MFDEYKYLESAHEEPENPLVTAGIHPEYALTHSPQAVSDLALRLVKERFLIAHPDRNLEGKRDDDIGDMPQELSDLLSILKSPEAMAHHIAELRGESSTFSERLRDLEAHLYQINKDTADLSFPFADVFSATQFAHPNSVWSPVAMEVTLLPINVRTELERDPGQHLLRAAERAVRQDVPYNKIPKAELKELRERVERDIQGETEYSDANVRANDRLRRENPKLYDDYSREFEENRIILSDSKRKLYERRSRALLKEEYDKVFPETEIKQRIVQIYNHEREFFNAGSRGQADKRAKSSAEEFSKASIAAAQRFAKKAILEDGVLTCNGRVSQVLGVVSIEQRERYDIINSVARESADRWKKWYDLPRSVLSRFLVNMTDSFDPALINYTGWNEEAARANYLITATKNEQGKILINIEGEVQAVHLRTKK